MGLFHHVAEVLAREWMPPPAEAARWAVVTEERPVVYRDFNDDLRAWRGLFWTTRRDTAVEFAGRRFDGSASLLATYRPRREDIVAVCHVEDQVILAPCRLRSDQVVIERLDIADLRGEAGHQRRGHPQRASISGCRVRHARVGARS
jgi:hypothetical protein